MEKGMEEYETYRQEKKSTKIHENSEKKIKSWPHKDQVPYECISLTLVPYPDGFIKVLSSMQR